MRGLSEVLLLTPAEDVPGLVAAPGERDLSPSGLRFVGVKGAHRIPALSGGASEAEGESFLVLPSGDAKASLAMRSDSFLTARGGLVGGFVDTASVDAGTFDSDTTLLLDPALEDLTSIVSFESWSIPRRRFLSGVEGLKRSFCDDELAVRLSHGPTGGSSCQSESSLAMTP